MRVDAIINLVAAVALFFMMVAVGLGLSIWDLLKVARDWRLALRAGIANYLLVPAAAVGLLFLFQPEPMVAAGFLIAVVCPGAPFAPVLAAPSSNTLESSFSVNGWCALKICSRGVPSKTVSPMAVTTLMHASCCFASLTSFLILIDSNERGWP
jgi:predicted permease